MVWRQRPWAVPTAEGTRPIPESRGVLRSEAGKRQSGNTSDYKPRCNHCAGHGDLRTECRRAWRPALPVCGVADIPARTVPSLHVGTCARRCAADRGSNQCRQRGSRQVTHFHVWTGRARKRNAFGLCARSGSGLAVIPVVILVAMVAAIGDIVIAMLPAMPAVIVVHIAVAVTDADIAEIDRNGGAVAVIVLGIGGIRGHERGAGKGKRHEGAFQ